MASFISNDIDKHFSEKPISIFSELYISDSCFIEIDAKIFDGIKNGYIVASSDGLNIEQIIPFGLNGLPVPENTGASTIAVPFLINLYGDSPSFLCSVRNVSYIIFEDLIQVSSKIELSPVNL